VNPLEEIPVKIPFAGKFFTTDNLGNIFLIKKDNSIVKYDKHGTQKAIANFKIQGNLEQLDVSNPFELYAYYRDQQTVLILDNQLSQRGVITLNALSTGEITSACRSFDNGIWYFDAGRMKLVKTDKSLSNKKESLPFASWTSESWIPTQMIDNDKNLFMLDTSKGVAIFDVFGNYYKTVKITGLRDFQVKKNKLYFFQNTYYQRFDYSLRTRDTLFALERGKMVRLDADLAFEWKSDTLYVRPFRP